MYLSRQIVDLRKSGCTKCDLPICNESCPQIERHENLECQFFAKSKNNFSFRYNRILYYKFVFKSLFIEPATMSTKFQRFPMMLS